MAEYASMRTTVNGRVRGADTHVPFHGIAHPFEATVATTKLRPTGSFPHDATRRGIPWDDPARAFGLEEAT